MATARSSLMRFAGSTAASAGVALLVWSIRLAGTDAVVEGIRRVGTGFPIVLLLGGIRHALRSTAWWLCLEPADRPPLAAAFGAYVAGDALGNITPFGFLISEPSKVVLVRNRVGARASISALAIENLFYSASVIVMLVAGTAALLLSFDVPRPLRVASFTMLCGIAVLAPAVAWLVKTRRPAASRVFERFAPGRYRPALLQVRDIEDRVFAFAERRPATVTPVLALEAVYHVAAVAEIWLVLAILTGTTPSLLTAFVLEYVNRTITVAFQFIPLWLGVDEAGTGLMTGVLHAGAAVGVSLALVRKARMVVWTAIGVALLFHHGLSPRRAAREAELLIADR